MVLLTFFGVGEWNMVSLDTANPTGVDNNKSKKGGKILSQTEQLISDLDKSIKSIDLIYKGEVRSLLVDIHEKKAFKQDYDSIGEMFDKKYTKHRGTLYRELNAGIIEKALNKAIGTFKASTIRDFGRLKNSKDKLEKAYNKALEIKKEQKKRSLTAVIVSEAVRQIAPPPKKKKKQTTPPVPQTESKGESRALVPTKAGATPPEEPDTLLEELTDIIQEMDTQELVDAILGMVETKFQADQEVLDELRVLLADIVEHCS
jgi:hypothetical protein